MTTETERRTLTIKEVAEMTGLCTNTLYELAQRKELPGLIRFGKRVLVSKAAFVKALDEGWAK